MSQFVAELVLPGAAVTLIPSWFVLGAATLVGLILGSFLNVVIYRLPRRCQSVVRTQRSFCPRCKATIRWFDNIPLISFLLLNGRCRRCHAPIPLRYPLVELTMGLSVLGVVFFDVVEPGRLADGAAWLSVATHTLVLGALIAAAFIDAELTVIPDSITLGVTLIVLALAWANPEHGMIQSREAQRGAQQHQTLAGIPRLLLSAPQRARRDTAELEHYAQTAAQPPVQDWGLSGRAASGLGALIGAVCAAGGLWLLGAALTIVFAKKAIAHGGGSAMGLGDIKLLLLLGAALGWVGAALAVMLGAFLGVIVGVPRLVMTKKHGIPFGPFLAVGAAVMLLFGGPIVAALLRTYGPAFGIAIPMSIPTW